MKKKIGTLLLTDVLDRFSIFCVGKAQPDNAKKPAIRFSKRREEAIANAAPWENPPITILSGFIPPFSISEFKILLTMLMLFSISFPLSGVFVEIGTVELMC